MFNAKIMRDDGTHPNLAPHMKYDVGVLCHHAKNQWATGIDGLEIRPDSKDFVLMQFTGLHDKNGKEIYEGDIVRIIVAKRNYTVEYNDYCFKLIHADPKLQRMIWGPLYRLQELNFEVEIIGNIFETPELLKS
jgi:hypothetical protein